MRFIGTFCISSIYGISDTTSCFFRKTAYDKRYLSDIKLSRHPWKSFGRKSSPILSTVFYCRMFMIIINTSFQPFNFHRLVLLLQTKKDFWWATFDLQLCKSPLLQFFISDHCVFWLFSLCFDSNQKENNYKFIDFKFLISNNF